MRNLVQPPPSMRCERCDGELRFKLIEPDDLVLDTEIEIFVCAKCGLRHPRSVVHDRYAAHTVGAIPPGNVGQPRGSGGNRSV
jgi:hypothetical protein